MCGIVNVSHFVKHRLGNLSTTDRPFDVEPMMPRQKLGRPLSGQAEFGFGVRGHFDFAAQGFAAEFPAAGGAALLGVELA